MKKPKLTGDKAKAAPKNGASKMKAQRAFVSKAKAMASGAAKKKRPY